MATPAKSVVLLNMLLCVCGIYVCFGWWSVKQERLVTKPYEGRDGSPQLFETVFGMSFSQVLAGSLVSGLMLVLQRLWSSPPHGAKQAAAVAKSPFTRRDVAQLLTIATGSAFSTAFAYAAMRRLPYPVVLSAKMSKLLPVLLMGALWYRTHYSRGKVLSCLFITAGAVSFYLLRDSGPGSGKGNSSSPSMHTYAAHMGFAALFVNLFLDGFTYSTQDDLVKRRQWSGLQLMFASNASTTCLLMVLLALLECGEGLFLVPLRAASAVTGPSPWIDSTVALLETGRSTPLALSPFGFRDLSATWGFLRHHPAALHDVLLMSLLNAAGQIFIFHTISVFGSLTVTAMTLVRKSGSVVLSIVVHGHRVNVWQCISLIAVFAGVLMEGYMNVMRSSGSGGAPSPKENGKDRRAASSGRAAYRKKK